MITVSVLMLVTLERLRRRNERLRGVSMQYLVRPFSQTMSTSRNPKRKWKLYQEEAKTRQTSHWDLDYLTQEQLDALYREGKDAGSQRPDAEQGRHRMAVRPRPLLVGLVLMVLLAAVVLLFL